MGCCASDHQLGPRFRPRNLTGKEFYRVTYRSKLKPSVDIGEIIEAANLKNKRIDVGGALWCHRKTKAIRQVLEGEYRVVDCLLKAISRDKRHVNMVIEREEFPLTRFYGMWGGMVLADSPAFDEAIAQAAKDNLCRSRCTFRIKGKDKKESLAIAKKFLEEAREQYVERGIGGAILFNHNTMEFEMILEGERASTQAIISTKSVHLRTINFALHKTIRISDRVFDVLTCDPIGRLCSGSGENFTFKLKGNQLCNISSTVEMTLGNFVAILEFTPGKMSHKKQLTSAQLARGRSVSLPSKTLSSDTYGREQSEDDASNLPELKSDLEKLIKIDFILDTYMSEKKSGFNSPKSRVSNPLDTKNTSGKSASRPSTPNPNPTP